MLIYFPYFFENKNKTSKTRTKPRSLLHRSRNFVPLSDLTNPNQFQNHHMDLVLDLSVFLVLVSSLSHDSLLSFRSIKSASPNFFLDIDFLGMCGFKPQYIFAYQQKKKKKKNEEEEEDPLELKKD